MSGADQLRALQLKRETLLERQRSTFAQQRKLFKRQRLLLDIQRHVQSKEQAIEIGEKLHTLAQWQRFFDEQEQHLSEKQKKLKQQRKAIREEIKAKQVGERVVAEPVVKPDVQMPDAKKQPAAEKKVLAQKHKRGLFSYLFSEAGVMFWIAAAAFVCFLAYTGAVPLVGSGLLAVGVTLVLAVVSGLAYFVQDGYHLNENMKQWGKQIDNIEPLSFLKKYSIALGVGFVTSLVAAAAVALVFFPPAGLVGVIAAIGASKLVISSLLVSAISGVGFSIYKIPQNIYRHFHPKAKKEGKEKKGFWEQVLLKCAGWPAIIIGTVAAGLTAYTVTVGIMGVGIVAGIATAFVAASSALGWFSQDGNSLQERMIQWGKAIDKTNAKEWVKEHKWDLIGAAFTAVTTVAVAVVVAIPPLGLASAIGFSSTIVGAAVAGGAAYFASRVIVGAFKGASYLMKKLTGTQVKQPKPEPLRKRFAIKNKQPVEQVEKNAEKVGQKAVKAEEAPIPAGLADNLRNSADGYSDDSSDMSDDSVDERLGEHMNYILGEEVEEPEAPALVAPEFVRPNYHVVEVDKPIDARLLGQSMDKGIFKAPNVPKVASKDHALALSQQFIDQLDPWLKQIGPENKPEPIDQGAFRQAVPVL